MRKILIAFATLLMSASVLFGQEDPAKAFKTASRALSAYSLDQASNSAKLEEAMEAIEIAITGAEEKAEAKTWQKRGEIYNAVVAQDVNQIYTNAEHELDPKSSEYAMMAMKSFRKAHELAEKKYETKDAMTGLRSTVSYQNQIGNIMLQKQRYVEAYPSLQAVLTIQELFEKEGEDPVFAKEEDMNNHKFVTAFCANLAGSKDDAMRLFKELYEGGYQEPAVYSSYFALLLENDREEDALAVMEKGKELFPGNTELLFAEINYYLQENRLDELVGKLQTAIEKEPDNMSLYSTLGSVYDNLFQREAEAGNEEKAKEYFDNALKYYNQALDKDPKFFDAVYSIGALYYNKAASLTKEMQELEEDYSREGLKKYEAKREEVFSFFDKALPYFKKAESINPNDVNTLIALKEIFARKDDLDTSNEIKVRLENVQAGQMNESSLFNE